MVLITSTALAPSPTEHMKVYSTSIIIRYSNSSARACLNFCQEKLRQVVMLTPSALMPHHILNENMTARAMMKPFVGVK